MYSCISFLSCCKSMKINIFYSIRKPLGTTQKTKQLDKNIKMLSQKVSSKLPNITLNWWDVYSRIWKLSIIWNMTLSINLVKTCWKFSSIHSISRDVKIFLNKLNSNLITNTVRTFKRNCILGPINSMCFVRSRKIKWGISSFLSTLISLSLIESSIGGFACYSGPCINGICFDDVTNSWVNRAFRLVVQSLFVFASSNFDWLK